MSTGNCLNNHRQSPVSIRSQDRGKSRKKNKRRKETKTDGL